MQKTAVAPARKACTVQEFNLSDELWERLAALLPVHTAKAHPLGCHRPRVADRQVLDGIFFVPRTGCQWKALDATAICSGSTAHARFQEWRAAGFFARAWEAALHEYDELKGLDWNWLAMDGAMIKAPLGGEKNRPQPDRPRQGRGETKRADRGGGHPRGPGVRCWIRPCPRPWSPSLSRGRSSSAGQLRACSNTSTGAASMPAAPCYTRIGCSRA